MTCRSMMTGARTGTARRPVPSAEIPTTAKSSVIYLAEVLRIRRERRFGNGDPGSGVATSSVVYKSRETTFRQRA